MHKQLSSYGLLVLLLLSYPVQAVLLAYAVQLVEALLVGIAGIYDGRHVTLLANLLLMGLAYTGMMVLLH